MVDMMSWLGKKGDAAPKPTTNGRRKRVVTDSDEEEAPKAKRAAKYKPSSEEKDTSTSDYFASSKGAASSKPKQTAAHPKTTTKPSTRLASPTKSSPAKSAPAPNDTPRKSTRNATRSVQKKPILDDENDDEEEDEDEFVPEEVAPPPSRASKTKSKPSKPADDSDLEMEQLTEAKPPPKARAVPAKKPAAELDDDEDGPPSNKSKKPATPAKKKSVAASKTAAPADGTSTAKTIIESIPLIRPPSPPPPDEGGKKKFPFGGAHANSGPPPEAGSIEKPEGAENCLAGLTFVFTGLLKSLERDEGINYIKQYGGKVVGAPSKNTTFVVLGDDAGPSKLRKIKDLNIKTIDEKGLYELVGRMPANGGDSEAASKQAEKVKKEEANVKAAAKEMADQDAKMAQQSKANAKTNGAAPPKAPAVDSRLWTVKYAPQSLSHICGNKAQVEKLQRWLHSFEHNQKVNFKMPGKDGSGIYRAVMIHGAPGIGKTTAAHLVAHAEGYDVVESNASDTRSKKLIETGLKSMLDTTSLAGYFTGDGKTVQQSKRKLLLIMDEVDGMSAGDRGGIGAMAAICKKSQIPLILVCNDRRAPKMRPFDGCTYDLPFRRPTADQIKGRIMTILYREGMKLPPPVLGAIIDGTSSDLRQIVNMISSVKLDQEAMEEKTELDFDGSKKMSKAWEKHIVLKPWDIVSKILGGGMFASSSKARLNDKIELYFNDHEFSYLMLQENYIGTSPILANAEPNEKRKRLKHLDLVGKAADSISDGDLVDRMIHGSQQQWSLMPAHAVFSFVRPASFVSGSMAGNKTAFTSWLGKNSAQGKATRLVKEIQGHMRLRTTGDRHEIRQEYLPVLWTELVKKLSREGKDGVDAIIALMDSYFLTKDDFDSIMELGVGPMTTESVKIDSGAKSAFTREYNKREHPVPFLKASSVVAPKGVAKAKPDLEEAIDESEDDVVEVKEEDDDEGLDLSKDKYIKMPKKKAAPKKGPLKQEDSDAAPASGQTKAKKGKAKAKGKK